MHCVEGCSVTWRDHVYDPMHAGRAALQNVNKTLQDHALGLGERSFSDSSPVCLRSTFKPIKTRRVKMYSVEHSPKTEPWKAARDDGGGAAYR
jgi:hypothetical protein